MTELQRMPTNSVELWAISSDVRISSRETSVMDVRNLELPKISSIGPGEGTKVFAVMIVLLTEYFGTSWSDPQVKEMSNEMFDNFKHWTAADLTLFSKRCKGLFYGKIYGTFAPAVLMDWCNAYDDEWIEVSEIRSMNKHKEMKHEDTRRFGEATISSVKQFLQGGK